MKILIVVERSPAHRYLVRLYSKKLIKEVRCLIDDSKHSEAVAVAVSKGSFEKAVLEEDMHDLDADLILTEKNARWNIMR